MTTVELGPVIGKVTHSSARILVQVDNDSQVTCVASDPNGNKKEDVRTFKAGRIGSFEFSDLKPDTVYDITFQGASCDIASRVRTMPKQPTRLNVGAVSCNWAVKLAKGEEDMWADLRDRYVYPGEIDLLLHVGDQIYGDSAFHEAIGILNGKKKATKKEEEAILALYRKLYFYAWRHPATRAVLAQVSNLMIWDDHEIRDDWGSRPEDSDPTSAEHYIGKLARRVFREYQRQLWDTDPTRTPKDGFEHHFHTWGEIGVMFIDQRGGRSFETDSARPYLGTPQWEEIKSALDKNGQFSSVRALIVVTSVPLIYLSRRVTNRAEQFADDLKDHWSYGSHSKEQIEFIRLLRRWKEDEFGKREFLVVGGDVHLGGHTEVFHNERLIFKQLITSPITNKPLKRYEYSGIKSLLEINEGLGANYTFEHKNNIRCRNYGMIVLRIPEQGIPLLAGDLEVAQY